jgi:fibronectin-binding autotransporter adhesin
VRILTSACAAVAAFASCASPARAVDYHWINPSGGDFGQPAFWTPYDPAPPPPIWLGPGGATDVVHFDRHVAPENRYSVTNIQGENDQLLVHTDSVQLDIVDYLLNSDGGYGGDLDQLSFVAGGLAGDVADVVLTGIAGASLTSGWSSLAHDPSSTGLVTVTGGNWDWDAGQLFVGEWGSGTLNIENGGTVSGVIAHVGMFANSTGVVRISGADSSWGGGSTTVGLSGTGTVIVEHGGTCTPTGISLGNSAAGTGTFIVRGSGSTCSSGGVVMGYNGIGTLLIEDGGSLDSSGVSMGGWDDQGFGTASATVSGDRSAWRVNPFDDDLPAFTVGRASAATVSILDGGLISVVGRSYLGYRPGATGAVSVSGAESTWTNSDDLFVGREGAGELTIEARGSVSNATGWIGDLAGSTGAVVVRGGGATWTNEGDLFVGDAGSGELTVEAGASVYSEGAWIGTSPGSNGAVSVTDNRSQWRAVGQFIVGYRSHGELAIASGASVDVQGDSFIGFTLNNDSRATVTGTGSRWTNSGSLTVGHSGEGTLSVQRGGLVSAEGGMTVGLSGRVTGDGTIVADVVNSGAIAPGNSPGSKSRPKRNTTCLPFLA